MQVEAAGAIKSYHAHVYFRDEAERAAAARLRTEIEAGFPVRLGRWQEQPIGPHAAPMYQVAFANDIFGRLVPWLMLNRGGLVILIHPNTRQPRADHLFHSFWMGEVLPILHPEALDEMLPDEPE